MWYSWKWFIKVVYLHFYVLPIEQVCQLRKLNSETDCLNSSRKPDWGEIQRDYTGYSHKISTVPHFPQITVTKKRMRW